MPGPSNRTSRKNQRKSQVKARQAKSSGTSATSRTTQTLKGSAEDASEQRVQVTEDDRRQSVGSDLSLSSTGLRTPVSPRVEGQVVVTRPGSEGAGTSVEGTRDGEEDIAIIPIYDAKPAKELPIEDLIPLETASSSRLPTPHYPGEIKELEAVDTIVLEEPCIHDPGNGPRVRDMRAFLKSRFFAQGPALDDPLRAEFAQEEVLQMLKTVLPEEMAMILWYNKSRATSRICPACHRLFRVGDVLSDTLDVANPDALTNSDPSESTMHPQLIREQDLSGLCTSMCFILAALNQCDPATIKVAWGHTSEEIDEAAWTTISQMSRNFQSSAANELIMVLRMTRLSDLGLAQLCFPDLNWESSEHEEA